MLNFRRSLMFARKKEAASIGVGKAGDICFYNFAEDRKIIDNAVFGKDYYITNLTEGPISINFTEYYMQKSTICFTAATDITVNIQNRPYKLICKNGVPQLNPAKFYRLTLNEMADGRIVPYLLIDAVLDEFDTETTE